MTTPPPPEGYRVLTSGYDEILRGVRDQSKGEPNGAVVAYLWGEWRPVIVRRRTQRGVTVAYLGLDGNRWTGGESRVEPDRVAVRRDTGRNP